MQAIGIDPAEFLQVSSLQWNPGSSDAAVTQLASGRWLIANGIFAGQAGLSPGQAVDLDTPNGRRTYFVAGVGNDYLKPSWPPSTSARRCWPGTSTSPPTCW